MEDMVLRAVDNGLSGRQILNLFSISREEFTAFLDRNNLPGFLVSRLGSPPNRKSVSRRRSQIFEQVSNRKQAVIDKVKATDEQDRTKLADEILAQYVPGENTISSLARDYGVPYHTLLTRAHVKGISLTKGRPSLGISKKEIEERGRIELSEVTVARHQSMIREVVEHGLTLEEVAKKQTPPISRERVRQILARYGHKVGHRKEVHKRAHDHRRFTHPEEEKIISLLREGNQPTKAIMAEFGLPISYIVKLRKAHDIPKVSRLNWRSEERKQTEKEAIDAYYNRMDLTGAQISRDILKCNNSVGITQLIARRGLPRTRGERRWGKNEARSSTGFRYSNEKKKAVFEDYINPDLTLSEIAVKHNMTDQSIYTLCMRNKVKRPSGARRMTGPDHVNKAGEASKKASFLYRASFGIDIDAVVKAGRAACKSYATIAKEYGLSKGMVSRTALKFGLGGGAVTKIKTPSSSELKSARNLEIINKRLQNVKVSELSKEYGIAQPAIYKILSGAHILTTAKKKPSKIPDGIRETIATLYSQGVSRKDLFQRYPELYNSNSRLDAICARYRARRPEQKK